jgi:hypothetical protein
MKPHTSDRTVSPARPTTGISRRAFCFAGLLAPLAAFAPYQQKTTGSAESQFQTVLDSLGRIARAEPKLPGVQSLMALDEKRLAKGFSPADQKLLEGALYLEGITQLEKAAAGRASSAAVAKPLRPITEADVREALSKPIDTSSYGHEYFARVLREAKARAATDRAYRRRLTDASGPVARRSCITNHTPMWICIAMGIIITVMVIAILVAI